MLLVHHHAWLQTIRYLKASTQLVDILLQPGQNLIYTVAKERQGGHGHQERLIGLVGLLEDLIHLHQDGPGYPVLLSGPIRLVVAICEGNIILLLGMEICAEQGKRGVANSAPNILPRPD
jgi:hypothetical protein